MQPDNLSEAVEEKETKNLEPTQRAESVNVQNLVRVSVVVTK
jgi:hypothetical protein